jgi:protein gp37
VGKNSTIGWTDHSFNPWIGCTRVSPGCDLCYAERQTSRWYPRDGLWAGSLRRTSAANWREPLTWNAKAEKAARRERVFCASWADVFDNQAPEEWRADLFRLIDATPHLDWMLLTKRPQNIRKMLPPGWGDGWPHVWLGCTAENQTEAERRIPLLLAVPAAVRFLSCEPLLEPLQLDRWLGPGRIDWIICGGEDGGRRARFMQPEWAQDLLRASRPTGTKFFMKQMTNKKPVPPELMVREWPV